jgi:hypothetical protein
MVQFVSFKEVHGLNNAVNEITNLFACKLLGIVLDRDIDEPVVKVIVKYNKFFSLAAHNNI